uniref:Uncharacterized protein n=1 Tax=Sinocyclocheilus grahami TaxID=75366 RepID=A0A672QSV3_SINGR
MFVLGLITCVVLRAFSAQAKVVHSFDECVWFFYRHTEPSGMDQNAEKICQKLQNEEYDYTDWYSSLYYATLYSVHHKIPLYSAYTLDPRCSSSHGRTKDWSLEPQISQPGSQTDYMVRENQNNKNLYKGNQAISSDYRNTTYDHGCKATFTLTNAAPMDACFNRVHWNRWESTLRGYLIQKLVMDGGFATAFIVTGTVPDPNVWIPHRGTSEEPERVSVPSHIWTAVCYKHDTDNSNVSDLNYQLNGLYREFSGTDQSISYIGRNHLAEPGIRRMNVSDLNDQLSGFYSELPGTHQSIKIFGVNNKLVEVQGMFHKLINLPENQAGSACPITNAKPQVRKMDDELRKTKVSAGPDAVECQLVPEKQKTAANGSRYSSVTESDYSCQCNTGAETKPCCSSPCLYMDRIKGYRCYSDQKLIECSPRYSLITVNGDRCLDDYPCATYGEEVEDGADADGCLRGCYTDDEDNHDQCCTSNDCYSTVNHKTCRSDHACGYHDYNYLWCYTDREGNWDYCCRNCRQ